jgi:hypothetical protein
MKATLKNLHVTRDLLLSADFTRDMLLELSVGTGAYTIQGATQMADAKMSRPSKILAGLDCPKLRTALIQKFEVMYPDFTEKGFMYNEQKVEEDLDIGKAGANNKRKSGGRASSLKGEYEIVKKTGNAESDEGKWAIWQHVWACKSFEEFFAVAPVKSITKTGRVITASSEIQWALKSGWIKPKVAEQQAESAEQQGEDSAQ